MPWYKGKTVLEALDLFKQEIGLETKPLRLPIQDVYKFDSRRIIAGRVEFGTLKIGDEILISPDNKTTKVKSIEHFVQKDSTDTVSSGMSVGITFEDEFFNKRGEIISHKKNSPFIADIFKANIFWMGKNNFVKGKKYNLKLVTQEVECEIIAFNKVIDATTLGTYENARGAKTNDVAEVTIKTKEKICFDKFSDDQNTGRFVVVDGYDISGGGIVSGLVESNKAIETSFIKDEIKLSFNCFDEYYYDLKASVVKKKSIKTVEYSIGKDVPYRGESYNFKENFNLIDVNAAFVAKIRYGKLEDVIAIDEYEYEKISTIDENGFGINLSFKKDLENYIEDFKKGIDAIITNKWINFTKYRSIKFKDIMQETPEYII